VLISLMLTNALQKVYFPTSIAKSGQQKWMILKEFEKQRKGKGKFSCITGVLERVSSCLLPI
jgi:hypothetical protein